VIRHLSETGKGPFQVSHKDRQRLGHPSKTPKCIRTHECENAACEPQMLDRFAGSLYRCLTQMEWRVDAISV
jgi:hypothetical protein